MPEKIEQIKTNSDPKKLDISLKPEDMVGKFHIEESKKREEIIEKAKNELIESLSSGSIYYKEDSLENIDNVRQDENEDEGGYDDYDSDREWTEPQYDIPDEVKFSPEVQSAARQGVSSRLENGNIDQAIRIKRTFSLPVETISSPEQLSTVNDAIIGHAREGDIEKVKEILTNFFVRGGGEEMTIINSPEVEQPLKLTMADLLSKGYTDRAIKLKGELHLPDQIISSPEVHEAIKNAMLVLLSEKYVDPEIVKRFKDNFPLPPEDIQKIGENGMIFQLQDGHSDNALQIKYVLSLPGEVFSSPEIQAAATKEFARMLLRDEYRAKVIIKEFMLPSSIFSTAEVQQAAKNAIINCLIGDYCDVNKAIDIKNTYAVSNELFASAEVQNAATQAMINQLSAGEYLYLSNSALGIKEKFLLSPENVQEAAKKGIENRLLNGSADIAIEIRDKFSVPVDFISSPRIQNVVKAGMIKCLVEGNVDKAITMRNMAIIHNDFVSSVDIQDATKKGIVKLLSSGSIDRAIQLRDSFTLSAENVEIAASEGLLARLLSRTISNYLEESIKIKDSFALSDNILRRVARDGMSHALTTGNLERASRFQDGLALSTEDTSQASKQAFLKCLAGNKTETAENIREKFKVSVNSEDIFNVISEMRTLLSSLRDISPEFATQAEKTPDLLLSLVEFRNNPDIILNVAKENPFLLDAIANNPRFGSRLLVKYRQFDNLSKESIRFQFAAKKKIMAENPEIDPQSVEFRTFMQEALKEYGKNLGVIEEIDKKKISSEQWLNYDETAYFNLGSNENTLAFSEILSTPIGRIRETIDTYAYTIKDVLKEYRDELLKFEIKLGVSEAPTEELQKMMTALEKAKAESNTKKISGIEKGMENLKSKSSQEKKGVLWEKLLADVASFQRLKDDVFKSQEIFIATEKELADALAEKMPSGKKIQDIKRKIATAKEDLRSKFMVMERRIEEFRANLKNMIAPAIGDGRADALIQGINTKLAEQFNHFDADRSMLKNLFSGQSDKKKEEMESRPMSIFVWTRDPDIDLYQGNYSLCCIRIDSEYHGAESPIADYNTDLGIQIVNIWDETKNEPITAAWCWLGEDGNGQPALIVDNIECNTLYSANFSEQLTKELFSYLEDYAKAIGVKKIVLGKANNDMPTAGELSKWPDDAEKYKKIGGANRSDGYFLEAEDVSVKVIWKKGKKAEVKKEESKRGLSAERVVFSEINTQALTESDFNSVRDLERRIYANDVELIQGQELVQDIKDGNGLEYSVAIWGVAPGSTKQEMIAYAVAVEDETDEGDKSVYLEDIAVAPEARRQGLGWKLTQGMIQKLKTKAEGEGKPVLFDMHLRPNSLSMLDAHREILAEMGVVSIEEALVPDYYGDGDDAVYRVYEVSPSQV